MNKDENFVVMSHMLVKGLWDDSAAWRFLLKLFGIDLTPEHNDGYVCVYVYCPRQHMQISVSRNNQNQELRTNAYLNWRELAKIHNVDPKDALAISNLKFKVGVEVGKLLETVVNPSIVKLGIATRIVN